MNLKSYLKVSLKKRSDFTVIVGDFNVRSTTWWSDDITTTESTSNIEALTSYHGFEQVINEPAPILPNSASWIQCQTQSIFGDTIYWCYCKFRLVTPPWWELRGRNF